MGTAQLDVLNANARLHDAIFTVLNTEELRPEVVAINYFLIEPDEFLPCKPKLIGTWTDNELPEQFQVTFNGKWKEPGKIIYFCTPVPSTPHLENVDLRLEYDTRSHQMTGHCINPFKPDDHVVRAG